MKKNLSDFILVVVAIVVPEYLLVKKQLSLSGFVIFFDYTYTVH